MSCASRFGSEFCGMAAGLGSINTRLILRKFIYMISRAKQFYKSGVYLLAPYLCNRGGLRERERTS
jgi:hypothetical protein